MTFKELLKDLLELSPEDLEAPVRLYDESQRKVKDFVDGIDWRPIKRYYPDKQELVTPVILINAPEPTGN